MFNNKAKLIKASTKHKGVIENLMQFYMYDFSEFIELEVEENGLFKSYQYLDDYFKDDDKRFAHIIQQNEKNIGFILVRFIESDEQNNLSIAEFFVLKKYRKQGIGKAMAHQVFDLHHGKWEVFQKESNKPAQLFWNKVIGEYTKGNFEERFIKDKHIQSFEN